MRFKITCYNIAENMKKYMTWNITSRNGNSFDMSFQTKVFLLNEIDSS